MKAVRNFATLLVALTLGSSAFAAASWDLAGDWNPPANPNGAWTYGAYDGGSFTNLTNGDYAGVSFVSLPYVIDTNNTGLGGAGGYAATNTPDGYIYVNFTGSPAYGIAPGQVAFEADVGTPVARWTAPASGLYGISVMIGGTTASEGGGFGNNFAQFAGLDINMVAQTAASFSNNVMSWAFSAVMLSAGTTVDAYVANPGYANGGNTQTIFYVVAEPLLAITNVNNQVIVSWPIAVTNGTLQTNINLATGSWGNYLGAVVNNSVTNSPPTGNLFFRLTHP